MTCHEVIPLCVFPTYVSVHVPKPSPHRAVISGCIPRPAMKSFHYCSCSRDMVLCFGSWLTGLVLFSLVLCSVAGSLLRAMKLSCTPHGNCLSIVQVLVPGIQPFVLLLPLWRILDAICPARVLLAGSCDASCAGLAT
jgi:hypothetical protein